MRGDPKKTLVLPADGADPVMDALLEELRQAQAEMERLSSRVTKLLGKPKELPDDGDRK